jgi:alpha-amylase
LEHFLGLVSQRETVETVIPGKLAKQSSPKAKIYIRAGASPDVIDCLLPADKARRAAALKKKKVSADLKALSDGGLFRQFLCRYRESNWMYSKMMYTHILVNQIRGDKYRKKTAREEMWKGQSHFGYWHGSMGGIYWPSVRKEHYRAFIEAERLTRSDGIFTPSIISFDFDMDGRNEYVYQGRDINAYVHHMGGILFELDYIPCRWNYGDTLSRIPEYYHVNGEKIYDRYMRKCFADHFLDEGEAIRETQDVPQLERGDFLDQEYELYKLNREHRELTLGRDGGVRIRKRTYPLNVRKKYVFKRGGLEVEYTITNLSGKTLDLRFGSEINLSFPSKDSKHLAILGSDKSKRVRIPSRPHASRSLGRLQLKDLKNRVQIAINSSEPFSLWTTPLETVSRTLCRRERHYQGSCFLPLWNLRLEPDQSWSNRIGLSFSRQKRSSPAKVSAS